MTPYQPSVKSQECIIQFARNTSNQYIAQWNIREQLRQRDLAYIREQDWTEEQAKAKMANKRGDSTKFQNVTVPVVLPQVEAAVAYQQSVFLTGYPIFSAVSIPEFASEANQMDTIIGEQQERSNFVHELLLCIRDGFKYNLQAAEVSWEKEVTYSLTTDLEYQAGQEGRPTELIWQGNKIRRMDLYNTFWDTRVAPRDVSKKGEYAGYNEVMSRIALKQFAATLPYRINMTEAFESGFNAPISTIGASGNNGYYYPQLNPESCVDMQWLNGTNWAAWAGFEKEGKQIDYKDSYQVTTLYGRILPSDFGFKGVPGQNTPQIWKFIIINNQVVIYAERMTNAHNLLPIVFAQPLDDGLAYQTKSFAQNVEAFQSITTALANSSIASRRRAISDRMLYDPSRVSAAAINNDSPNAKIPVRPSAYQQELSKAVYAIPFRDDQFQINMAEMQSYMGMANQISGLNQARQGNFVKGNKTKYEYADIMANANGRDQSIALTLEGNFFWPIKEIIKTNILQYQGGVELYNRDSERMVTIDPVALRKANLVMKVSDGLAPSDKLIDGESLAAATQFLAQNQSIGLSYNVGDMFAYLFKSRGVKLDQFKKPAPQVAFEQAMAQWQGAISALVEQLAAKEMSPEQIQAALSTLPQPTPEQYGYIPGSPTLTPGAATTPNSPTILSSMSQTIQAANQQQNAQAAAQSNLPSQGAQA